MPTEHRSPWFNARTQPPVNGYVTDEYEWRCPGLTQNGVDIAMKQNIRKYGDDCPRCQWRGLLRDPK